MLKLFPFYKAKTCIIAMYSTMRGSRETDTPPHPLGKFPWSAHVHCWAIECIKRMYTKNTTKILDPSNLCTSIPHLKTIVKAIIGHLCFRSVNYIWFTLKNEPFAIAKHIVYLRKIIVENIIKNPYLYLTNVNYSLITDGSLYL